MAALLDITGVVYQVRRPVPDSDFTICHLEDGTVAVGNAEEGELVPGLPYTFYGVREVHAQHGPQLKFRQFVQRKPHGRRGVVAYLSRYAPNIGPSLAGQLFDRFGSEAVKVLRTQPELAAGTVRGLTPTKAREAAEALQQLVKLEDTKIDLTNLFAGRGFPGTLIDLAIKRWNILAPARIRRDPFALLVADLPGCGFARCDRLYKDLGLPVERLKRQVLCLWHAMREDMQGHTWLRGDVAKDLLGRSIDGLEPDFGKAVKVGVRSGWLAERWDELGRLWLADGKRAGNEMVVAERVRELLQGASEASNGVHRPA